MESPQGALDTSPTFRHESGMTVKDVQEIILARMLDIYLPPTHLRQNQQAQQELLRGYEEALARFAPATLERAWHEVVGKHQFWIWPHAGTFAATCERLEPARHTPAESHESSQKRQAQEMTDTFTRKYRKKSKLAQEASKAGWLPQLMEYVTASAWCQAQLICQVTHIGWSSLLLSAHLGEFHSATEAFQAFRATLGEHLEKGEIQVKVPKGLIARWKEEAQTRQGRERS